MLFICQDSGGYSMQLLNKIKFLALLLTLSATVTFTAQAETTGYARQAEEQINVDHHSWRFPVDAAEDLNDVVATLIVTGELPVYFRTKREAKRNRKQRRHPSGKKYMIGGDHFRNREGRLPAGHGLTYIEVDIGTRFTKNRGRLRVVYSNELRIYFTHDHYGSFVEIQY